MLKPVIGTLIACAFGAFFGGMAVWSTKNGRYPTRGGFIRKEESPLLFKVGLASCWLVAAVMFISGLFQLALALKA